MREAILIHLIDTLQNDPELIARLLLGSLIIDIVIMLGLSLSVWRIRCIEIALKKEWPMKFLGKL